MRATSAFAFVVDLRHVQVDVFCIAKLFDFMLSAGKKYMSCLCAPALCAHPVDLRHAQVEVFCIAKLINCMIEADEEFIVMDFQFATGDGGLRAVLELVHLLVQRPVWDASAMERAKQMFLSNVR